MDNKLRKSAATEPAEDKKAELAGSGADTQSGPELEEFYQKLQPEMRRPKPSAQEMAAALEAVQRLAVEAGAEDAAADLTRELTAEASGTVCQVCGYRNRESNKFCGMCGQPVDAEAIEAEPMRPEPIRPEAVQDARQPRPFAVPRNAQIEQRSSNQPTAHSELHHYHHHYHHHYFPGGQESGVPRVAPDFPREVPRDAERLKASPVLRGESMSRAEVGVRRTTQEWILACNTKHLDDLLELYAADATVLRSNHPAVRGAAAIREFFFNALDAGLGEVELDPQRIEIAGDFAYESGSCKALVPGASGKRREERGKYLWVLARQNSGEWKVTADCWSSDLTLPTS